jgi:glutathione synthase/RimK-type ligase-like ATP-grasp enzyme
MFKTVNSFVAEDISRNKFLQYHILKDSKIGNIIPKATMVGLGTENRYELEDIMDGYDSFVVKPVLGTCGRGIRFLTKDELRERYLNNPLSIKDFIFFAFRNEKTVEALIKMEDFGFEYGVSIVQPFIDSRRDEHYSSIRAIVCNGEFIDAYQRLSLSPRVNLSQDAKAVSYEYDRDFINLCEKVIQVFEEKVSEFDNSYKKSIYQKYLHPSSEDPLMILISYMKNIML